ncbi:hypothetical protein AcW1_007331 [Taiwanofungus camphoratus]|nr:hypothetical protein AcW2_007598 [Antrodia cinnamomea]KAI0920030.1 hypothetical protein AcV7_006040 [Antrodia cinnamomea]KAI0927420.1 hypothetical protein AcV5_007963 [Antrodia cinnamomea]KAI0952999.1 hypothetical protein AcW1_007331 [Antrodia cinnamomea]
MAEMSSAVWKRTPTTAEALFGVMLPYQPPRNPVAAFFWRKRVIVETSTGTVGLDVWEKVLVVSVFFLMLTYVCTGIIKYLPQYLMLLQRQVLYHLCDNGRESIGPVIQEWAAQNASRDL